MDNIKLTKQELSVAVYQEKLIVEAQAILNERKQALQRYVEQLRIAHNAPEEKYTLTDWLDGFVEVNNV